jgi:AraC-like DNA-binding protein
MPNFEFQYDPATANWSERQQYESFRELLGRAIMRLDIEPYSTSRPCSVAIEAIPLGALSISVGAARNLSTQHTSPLIDNDDIIFTATLRGARALRQHRRELFLTEGVATVLSAGETGHSAVDAEDFLTFKLPRAYIAPLVSDIDSMIVQPIPKDTEALRLLIHYGSALRALGAIRTPEAAHLASTHLTDLIALAIGATRDGGELARVRGLRAARLVALKNDIRDNLARSDLSVSELSARHGISTSYISKLFGGEGTTFTDFVLEQRLARAHRAICDPRTPKPISVIAFECGFGDLSYFNRTFRRRYRATPSDVREQALAVRSGREP